MTWVPRFALSLCTWIWPGGLFPSLMLFPHFSLCYIFYNSIIFINPPASLQGGIMPYFSTPGAFVSFPPFPFLRRGTHWLFPIGLWQGQENRCCVHDCLPESYFVTNFSSPRSRAKYLILPFCRGGENGFTNQSK